MFEDMSPYCSAHDDSLRQLVEKRLEKQGHMALAFVDLEKAFDTVPRKMAMATLRWMGAPESEISLTPTQGKQEEEQHDEWLILKLCMYVVYHTDNNVSNFGVDPVTKLNFQNVLKM